MLEAGCGVGAQTVTLARQSPGAEITSADLSLPSRRELPRSLGRQGSGEIAVSPRTVCADASRPDLIEGFTRQTFTAMVEGVRDATLEQGLVKEGEWEEGIRDLYRTAGAGGTFTCTFFRAVGVKRLNPRRGRTSTRGPGAG